jgi:predicted RNA-binding protein with RPS1 domain
LIQNRTPDQERSATTPEPIDGEIVGLEDARVRVRLETGAIGFIADAVDDGILSSFQLGDQYSFRVLQTGEDGEIELSLATSQDGETSPAFEHDVSQLQSALTQHPSTPAAPIEAIPSVDEQRIQQWLRRVDKALERLRRNRAKRLDEEFYSGS